MTEVHITKLAAARRQLSAAIRMFFAQEDALAVRTVASASYGLIRDLSSQRGRDVATSYYLSAIFYAVRSHKQGTLPDHITDDPKAMKFIEEWATKLPVSEDSDFSDYLDARASLTSDAIREFWRDRNRIPNFLKHADRDAKANISTHEIDNLAFLVEVLSAYVDISGGDLGHEGFILSVFHTVEQGSTESLSVDVKKVAAPLQCLSYEERL